MKGRRLLASASAALLIGSATPSFADVQYVYDSAGRVIRAIYSNGITIEYRYDSAGNRTQILTTAAPNQPPNAANDTATVATLGTVDLQVRANDSDPDGNSLTVTAVSAPTGGSAVILGAGTYIRYTAPGTAGVKTFTYTLSDGIGGTDSATVSVTVTSPASPPVAENDFAFATEGQSVAVMVLENDTDPNNDTLTVTGVSNITGGSAYVASGGGYVVYSAPGQGSYSFSYTVIDGNGGTAQGEVYITVSCSLTGTNQCGLDPGS